MTKPYVLMFLIVFSSGAMGHSGADPLNELRRGNRLLAKEQASFAALQNDQERMRSLENQLGHLERNVIILQDLIAKDYPHVRQNMSRYKLDYFSHLDESLKRLRSSLKQASQVVGQ